MLQTRPQPQSLPPGTTSRARLVLLGCLVVLGACTVEVHLPGQGVDKAPLPDAGPTSGGTSDGAVTAPASFHIERVEPAEGDVGGGDRITVFGDLFKEGATVQVGDAEALDVLFLGPQALNAEVPPGAPGLADVTVTNPDGASTTLKGGYRYLSPIVIAYVSPPAGPAMGGTPVTVVGTGFLPDSVLLIDGRAAINTKRVDEHTLIGLTPGGPVGSVDVFVANAEGSGRLRDAFTYHAHPAVSVVYPPNGPPAGGAVLNILGAGLEAVDTVTVGSTDAAIVARWGDDTITVLTPPGSPGPADVSVSTPYASDTLISGYAYIDPEHGEGTLELLTAVPNSGPASGGTTVTLSAYGLTDAQDLDVRFGVKEATVTSVDSEAHTATVIAPPGQPGPVTVSASSSRGETALPEAFTYLPDLEVTAVSPAMGPAAGGTQVTLFGKGFADGMIARVGPLPCTGVMVKNPTELAAVTPPGSPGPSNVSVSFQGATATLEDAFEFEAKSTDVIVSKPAGGAIAGGTFLRIFGTGFGESAKVLVGGAEASDVTVHDSTLITAITPPGELGPADVIVTTANVQEELHAAFTYFDPASKYGGTWGDAVDEAVNVTVLDMVTNDPVPGAFVVLTASADTPYQGVADELGQITFGGPGLFGRQVVTAAKANYTTASVIEFDATNVTLHLYPFFPPSQGGGPGEIFDDGAVSGRVTGLGKYVIVPPGKCANKDTTGLTYCHPCVDAADCGGGDEAACIPIGDEGPHCTTQCTNDDSCPPGYVCAAAVGGSAYCLPVAGKKEAFCAVSNTSIFEGAPPLDSGTAVAGDGTYLVDSRVGEVAIVCRGGYRDFDTGAFVPTVMGVARHLFVKSAEELPDQDVALDIPLDRTVELRLDDPPYELDGPNVLKVNAFLELGTDGIIPMASATGVAPDATYSLPGFPLILAGELYDASYAFFAGSYSGSAMQMPYSVTLHQGLTQVDDHAMLRRGPGGEWVALPSGLDQDLRSLWGTAPDAAWAVGDRGTIYRYDGEAWGHQPILTKKDLLGIYGTAPDDVYAVGAGGTALRFDGLKWSPEKTGTTKDLRAVWGTPGSVLAAGWFTLLHRGSSGWAPVEGAPQRNLHALWGSGPVDIWAVGAFGTALHFDGAAWQEVPVPTNVTLRGLWGTGTGLVFAVGDAGTVLVFDGTAWSKMADVPTTRPLRAVAGRLEDGALHLYVVGAGGTVLHHDGIEWVNESPATTATELGGVWGAPEGGPMLAVGTHALLLGPFMRVPRLIAPAPGVEAGTGPTFELQVDPGVTPHFRYVTIESAYGLPLWTLVTAGDATVLELPDLETMAGLDAIPKGPKKLQIYSVYKDGFDIDNFDNFDFRLSEWDAWSLMEAPFE